jgi:hypothetical protein
VHVYESEKYCAETEKKKVDLEEKRQHEAKKLGQ